VIKFHGTANSILKPDIKKKILGLAYSLDMSSCARIIRDMCVMRKYCANAS